MIIHVDIETFSPLDLTKVGVHRYSEEAEIQIIAWAEAFGEVRQIWSPFRGGLPPELLKLFQNPSALFYAHNAEFEYTLLNGPAGKKIGFPETSIRQWRCTMALAHSLALPGSLDRLGKVLGLPEKYRKIKGGTSLIRRFGGLRKPTKQFPNDRILPEEDPENFSKYLEYNKQDVVAERAVHHCLRAHELSEKEQRVWFETILMNQRGIPVDIKYTGVCADHVLQATRIANVEAEKICGISLSRVGELTKWLNKELPEDLELKDLQESTLKTFIEEWEPKRHLHSKEFYDIIRILQLRLAYTSAAVKKLKKIQEMALDDTVKGCYRYHGANTGRWSAIQFQPQNLAKPVYYFPDPDEVFKDLEGCPTCFLPSWYGDVLKTITSLIRSLIKAPEGKTIIVSDYSAIEFRVLCWVAGEKEALRKLEDGETPYKEMAAAIYEIPQEWVDDKRRALGKQATLGFGYQMGGRKFRTVCEGYGIDVPEKFEFRSCRIFRNKFPLIKQLWKDLDIAARTVILSDIGYPGRTVGRVKLFREGNFMFIELPSKRRLAYPAPRIGYPKEIIWVDDDGEEQTFVTEPIQFLGQLTPSVHWGYKDTYGGKLTENICQGVAADVMREGFLNLTESGKYLPFALSHDEAVSLVDTREADQEEYDQLLCQTGPWAEGLPLEAKGFITNRYKKG